MIHAYHVLINAIRAKGVHAMNNPHITPDDGAPVGTCNNHGIFRQYVCIKCYRELEEKLRMYEEESLKQKADK